MSFRESLSSAFRALGVNRLRSGLTMLGVVIGVAAVVTMVALGGGAHDQVLAQIRSLGANLLIVTPGSTSEGGARLGAGTRHTLTEDDGAAIAREVPSVTIAAPAIEGKAQIVSGNRNWSTSIVGAVPDHFPARDWRIASGSLFTSREVERAAKVAVLGATVRERLFEQDDPLGATVRIKGAPVTVIGVLAPKGNSASGHDQDDIVFVPLAMAKLRLLGGAYQADRRAVGYINVEVSDAAAMDDAKREIVALLRQRHRLAAGAPDDFTVLDISTVFAARKEASRTLLLFLAAAASISLLAGGINVMTMMLISVAERTREIGIRLAVGARRRDIRNQFLIEAVMLCALGGTAGITLGVVAAIALARFGGWLVFLDPAVMLVAFAVAAVIGVFFGLYPALRAARLDPVEALRSE